MTNLHELSNEELMAMVATGNTLAFNEIVKRHLKRSYSIARRVLYTLEEAEDATQEAFTKVWVNAKKWQPGQAAFTTWFYRIIINTCLDKARRKNVKIVTNFGILEAQQDHSQELELAAMENESNIRVRKAVFSLPPQQRAVITLCYFEEYTNAEAAKIMDIHLKALEALLFRARKKLKTILELK